MKFTLVCGTWIKEEDEKVLELLRKSDRWLTASELSAMTGLHPRRVEHTLHLMRHSMKLYRERQELLKWLESDEA